MATNLTLRSRRNELPERLIKRFIKKVKKSGIIDEVREKRHYKKPSEKRREARRRAIARQKKEMIKKKKNY